MSEPFRTGENVAEEYFTDRSAEVNQVVRGMLAQERILLIGERRHGKSSIIRQASLQASARGATILWVDLWTANRMTEILQRVVSAVPYSWAWREKLQVFLMGLGITLGMSFDAAGNPGLVIGGFPKDMGSEGPRRLLKNILERINTLADESGARVTLVLDEFQQLERIDQGSGALLRSIIQSTPHLGYVCAGSNPSLIESLLSPKGPFHGVFREITIGPIDPEILAPWIEDRMRGHGVQPENGLGEAIIRLAGPRTESCIRLAKDVFDRGRPKGKASLDDVVPSMRGLLLDGRAKHEEVWNNLADSQKNVLRAVASGARKLTSRETIRTHDLPTSAGVLKAIRVLQADHLLASTRPYQIADPFFREWILMFAMPDGRTHSGLDKEGQPLPVRRQGLEPRTY